MSAKNFAKALNVEYMSKFLTVTARVPQPENIACDQRFAKNTFQLYSAATAMACLDSIFLSPFGERVREDYESLNKELGSPYFNITETDAMVFFDNVNNALQNSKETQQVFLPESMLQEDNAYAVAIVNPTDKSASIYILYTDIDDDTLIEQVYDNAGLIAELEINEGVLGIHDLAFTTNKDKAITAVSADTGNNTVIEVTNSEDISPDSTFVRSLASACERSELSASTIFSGISRKQYALTCIYNDNAEQLSAFYDLVNAFDEFSIVV